MWLLPQKFLVSSLAKVTQFQWEKFNSFPRVYVTHDQVQWHLGNNLHLRCIFSLLLSFLLLNEKRTIGHHLFFLFKKNCLFSGTALFSGPIFLRYLLTVIQMLIPPSQVSASPWESPRLVLIELRGWQACGPRTIRLLQEFLARIQQLMEGRIRSGQEAGRQCLVKGQCLSF